MTNTPQDSPLDTLTDIPGRVQFLLTVSEGMWKGRPVIGSAVGGIIDQIAEGTGVLLTDAADLTAFGSAARLLLDDPAQATRMGQAAYAYVRENFLGDVPLAADTTPKP